MSRCTLCPRECGADREKEKGYCGAGDKPNIARAALHFWEEPCISGRSGSGAVFFCGCNLNCVFCQNNAINHTLIGTETDTETLCAVFLSLQKQGAHNINLVSPAPFADMLTEAIPLARRQGLTIPIVYNTNAYEKVSAIRGLAGLVDIYLPDLKYVASLVAGKYSSAPDYFEFASAAVEEMFAQVGLLQTDPEGIATRGIIIRHLVLPGSVDEARRVIDYIAGTFPKDIALSLMGQYVPNGDAIESPLNRKLLKREYDRAIDYAIAKGLTNVLIQKLSSASLEYTPEFYGFVI